MIYIGIDPGKTGALAALSDNYEPMVMTFQECFTSKIPNLGILGDWFSFNVDWNAQATIAFEDVHAMPFVGPDRKQGATSSFNFAKTAGMLYGYVIGYLYDYPSANIVLVSPQKWKNSILGKNRTKGKEASVLYCQQHYGPEILLRTSRSKVPDHNIADAICLAEYGRKLIGSDEKLYKQSVQHSDPP